MAKLFVSYSRKDSTTAKRIIQALTDVGQDIWVDWEDIPPSSDWMEQIKRGIEGSDAFIFLISPDSAASGYCRDEVNHAKNNNKRIIPVVIRTEKPDNTVDIIRKIHWIFMREPEEDFEEGIKKIKTAIESDFAWVEQHTRLQTRALEWEDKKEPSLLLRGADLRHARKMMEMAEQTKKNPSPSVLQKTYVEFSKRADQRNWFVSGVATLVIVILVLLSFAAVSQRNDALANKALADSKAMEAENNRIIAVEQKLEAERFALKAEQNARKAVKEKQAAEKAQRRAEESRKLAAAQRSAALAQIYQTQPGELFTSTLLAIDSWQTNPSDSAEEILRRNISLLPIPVAQMNHYGRINTITLNSEGTIFVTAGADGLVCEWQVVDGKKVFCVNSPAAVTDAVITPDDQTIITGDEQGNLLFINASDGIIERPFPAVPPITDLEIQGGRDPRLVAVTTSDGKITLFNWKTHQKTGSDFTATGAIHFAKFSPNGVQLATGTEDGLISIWNLNQVSKTIDTRKHRGEILALEFSPDGRYLVSGGADGAAVVLDAKTGNEIYRSLHSDQVLDITFSRDSKRFFTASKDRYVRVWDMETGKQLLIMSQSNAVQAVQMTHDDRWIAATGDDRTVRVWNATTGTEFIQIPIKGRGTALAFSRDDQYLISGGQNGSVSLWNVTGIPAPKNVLQFDGATASALYSPSGNWIAASDDRRAWLLNSGTVTSLTGRPTGNPIIELRSNISRMVFSAKDRWLGMLTVGNEIVLYNTQNRSGKTIIPANPVSAFAFSPDEKLLLTGDSSGSLQTWDVITGKLQNTPVTYNQPITAMSTAGNLLAIGLNNELRILDAATLQETDQPRSDSALDLLAFSPDGSLLASSNSNGQIQIWQMESGRFASPRSMTKANTTSLAFTPANDLLAIGAVDSLVLVDPATLEEFARIPLTGTVGSVSFSPDGNTFITASLRVLQFWNAPEIRPIPRAGMIETACRHLYENLSQSQWDVLYKDDEYRPLCEDLSTPIP